MKSFQDEILEGIPKELPIAPAFDPTISRAPARALTLTADEQKLAVQNALRYFPKEWHVELAQEFTHELATYGHIYMYRFRPTHPIFARPISEYPTKTSESAAILHMLQNNLDPQVAQHPYELITYGGNGAVFQNWAQYRLAVKLLAERNENQVLHLYSGHPLGLFPKPLGGPAVVVTNGMMVPAFSTDAEYQRLSALGVTSYGQMTAGSFMYIGPQGIVHGTYLTLLGAAQIHLRLKPEQDLTGVVFVSSGLGGMSGAQAKAARIAKAICVIAEINPVQAQKFLSQKWIEELTDDLSIVAQKILTAKKNNGSLNLGYVGNIVDLWEYLYEKNIQVDLGSDQTSLHLPYSGGYYPCGLSLRDSQNLIKNNPVAFAEHVHTSLKRHLEILKKFSKRGLFFWDYGNGFLRMCEVAGAAVKENEKFIYPSYVENIMGPQYFDYGFGPFRWVCTSADPQDLKVSDQLAEQVLRQQLKTCDERIKNQLAVNTDWIAAAQSNNLVVGSQARILYSDMEGRRQIAHALNTAVAKKQISAPVVLGRDHHDVSGTDSPYRETANIYDGSNLTADMAVHNFAGLAFQGASWLSLHNGGGVGWGQVINGGFGLVLDGSDAVAKRIDALFVWDVGNGIARRAWAGNTGAQFAIDAAQKSNPDLQITPNQNFLKK